MLDIATLLVSMGLQEEMKEVRQEAAFVNEAEQPDQEAGVMATAAQTAGEMLASVESTVVAAAENLVPSYEMINDMMPSADAFTVDLSLPSSSSSSSKKA